MKIMTVVNVAELGIANQIRGRIGHSGDPDPRGVFGIYQVRTRFGKQIQVKMAFYTPTNPQTQTQQAWRAVFTAGMDAWDALSEPAKQAYRDKVKDLPLLGHNLFLREYLLSH